MFRSSLLFIGFCLVLLVGDVHAFDPTGTVPSMSIPVPGGPSNSGSPSRQPRERDAHPPANEAVTAASQEVAAKVNAVLTSINEDKDPNMKELAETVKKNQQYLQRMDTKAQSDLQMLIAWLYYIEGDLKRAKIMANAAYRSAPQNKDAQSTFILMLLANNDTKMAKTTLTLLHKKPVKTLAGRNHQNPVEAVQQNESPAILNLDVNSIKTDLLDKNLGRFDVACLNGTSLPSKDKTLFMLLWAEKAGEAKTAFENSSQSGQMLSPIEAFASMFAKNFQNDKVAFLGLNLNAANESGEVMSTLMKNAWPWPQVMAQDSRNAPLASLAALRSEKPALVVVGSDGAIKYAGEFSGLVLRMMAAHPQAGTELAASAPIAAEKTTEKTIESNSVPPVPQTKTTGIKPAEANAPPVPQPNAAPQPRAQKTEEEKLNPAASNLYQFALSQKRMAYVSGWGTVVKSCRQILEQYPDSSEAAKARQLLREVPANKRSQYHITNEEMGL